MVELVPLFAALSDGTRFGVVERLMREGEVAAGALVAQSGLSAPAVSRHLKVLREAGVVTRRVQGTQRVYAVAPEALRAISAWTISHRAFWDGGLDRLEALLALEEGEGGDD